MQDDQQFGPLAPFYDELMQIVPYDSWAEYVMLLFSVAEHTPRRVLDCACGTGNVSFELARRGLDVTGVDLSGGMIEVARQKVASAALPVRFFEADLAGFDLGETFDAATCLYDSLNYILDPANLQAAFKRIAHHVERGGVFVFDMNSEFALQTNLFTQRNADPRKALHYDWRAQFDPSTSICSVSMEFKRQDADGQVRRFSEVHRERAYSLADVRTMLDKAGWQLLNVYDAYTLNRPHARSERWFFVARRIEENGG